MHIGLVVFDDVDFGLDLADGLYEMGEEVSLYLSSKHVIPYLGTAEEPAARLHDLGLVPRACNVRLYSLPRMRDLRSLGVIRQIARAIRQDGVDVLHILVGPGELWPALLSLLVRDRPVASTMIIPQPNVGEDLPAGVVKGIYRLLAWGSDVIVVNAADQVGLVERLYGVPARRVAYVPLGPRTTAVKWAAAARPEESGTVLFFGAARPSKGLEYLVQAQPLLTERAPQARILISSRGEELARCRALMHDPGRFEVHEGFVPGDLAAEFFQRASVVALPYLSASTSGILMTAFVFGKPVVATHVGALPEYVEEGVTGCLVPPADAEALADSIAALLNDDEQRRRMGANARRWALDKRKAALSATVRAYEQAIALFGRPGVERVPARALD